MICSMFYFLLPILYLCSSQTSELIDLWIAVVAYGLIYCRQNSVIPISVGIVRTNGNKYRYDLIRSSNVHNSIYFLRFFLIPTLPNSPIRVTGGKCPNGERKKEALSIIMGSSGLSQLVHYTQVQDHNNLTRQYKRCSILSSALLSGDDMRLRHAGGCVSVPFTRPFVPCPAWMRIEIELINVLPDCQRRRKGWVGGAIFRTDWPVNCRRGIRPYILPTKLGNPDIRRDRSNQRK